MTARFDGSAWTTVELPDLAGALLAPDGTPWAETVRGPARLDGGDWTYPYEGLGPWARGFWLGLSSVAPDGTMFGTVGSSIVRLPAAAP